MADNHRANQPTNPNLKAHLTIGSHSQIHGWCSFFLAPFNCSFSPSPLPDHWRRWVPLVPPITASPRTRVSVSQVGKCRSIFRDCPLSLSFGLEFPFFLRWKKRSREEYKLLPFKDLYSALASAWLWCEQAEEDAHDTAAVCQGVASLSLPKNWIFLWKSCSIVFWDHFLRPIENLHYCSSASLTSQRFQFYSVSGKKGSKVFLQVLEIDVERMMYTYFEQWVSFLLKKDLFLGMKSIVVLIIKLFLCVDLPCWITCDGYL